MKSILALSLFLSVNSFACSTYEAQFASSVKEVVTSQNDPYACQIKLDINLSKPGQSWRPHMICPLDIDVVLDQYVTVKNCTLKKGDKISGYILSTDNGLELE